MNVQPVNESLIQGPYQLRRLRPDEWPLLRSMRLEALENSPAVFGNGLTMELAFPDAHWQVRLSNAGNAVWALFHGDKAIGVTGIFTNPDDATEARLTTSYIHPSHRGRGLAALYYNARIAWARASGLKRLVVTHREGNEVSKSANQRAGFRLTHTEARIWPDGQSADNLFYAMEL